MTSWLFLLWKWCSTIYCFANNEINIRILVNLKISTGKGTKYEILKKIFSLTLVIAKMLKYLRWKHFFTKVNTEN